MAKYWSVSTQKNEEADESRDDSHNDRTINNQPSQGFEGMNYEQIRKPYTKGHVKLHPATNNPKGRKGNERNEN